jgi:hypothetical protein
MASFRIDELCDQSASPASDASFASPASPSHGTSGVQLHVCPMQSHLPATSTASPHAQLVTHPVCADVHAASGKMSDGVGHFGTGPASQFAENQ